MPPFFTVICGRGFFSGQSAKAGVFFDNFIWRKLLPQEISGQPTRGYGKCRGATGLANTTRNANCTRRNNARGIPDKRLGLCAVVKDGIGRFEKRNFLAARLAPLLTSKRRTARERWVTEIYLSLAISLRPVRWIKLLFISEFWLCT